MALLFMWRIGAFLLSLASLGILGLTIAIVLNDSGSDELTNEHLNLILLALGAVLATIGWIVLATIMWRAHSSRQAESEWQKENNTLRILMESRQGAEVEKHRRNILMRYPTGTRIPSEDVQILYKERSEWGRADTLAHEKMHEPTLDSITYLANYYEFISTAVEQEVLDELLITETIGPIMYNYYYKILNVIIYAQRLARQRNPENRLYASYQSLVERWEAEKLNFVSVVPQDEAA